MKNKQKNNGLSKRKQCALTILVITLYMSAITSGLSLGGLWLSNNYVDITKELMVIRTSITDIQKSIYMPIIDLINTLGYSESESNIANDTEDEVLNANELEPNIIANDTEDDVLNTDELEPNINTKTYNELLIESYYETSTFLYGLPVIYRINLYGNGEADIKVFILIETTEYRNLIYYADIFSNRILFEANAYDNEFSIWVFDAADSHDEDSLGGYNNPEIIDYGYMTAEYMEANYSINDFNIMEYPTIGDLREWYDSVFNEDERFPQMSIVFRNSKNYYH